jgi:hypothetical protein
MHRRLIGLLGFIAGSLVSVAHAGEYDACIVISRLTNEEKFPCKTEGHCAIIRYQLLNVCPYGVKGSFLWQGSTFTSNFSIPQRGHLAVVRCQQDKGCSGFGGLKVGR